MGAYFEGGVGKRFVGLGRDASISYRLCDLANPPANTAIQADQTLMPSPSDRQRIELAIPAYLLYSIASAPGVFVPADPASIEKAEADVANLREKLRIATLEPFADLIPSKHRALLRRLERIKRQATADWHDRPALSIVLMLWCFLRDLLDREILVLWEGSAMDLATRQLLPMFEHGFDEKKAEMSAQEHAHALLARLQVEGLYS